MTDLWKDDADLFAQARRELFTAVVGDVMDKLGFRHQFLPPAIKALERSMAAIGRAMTVLEADHFEEEVYICTGGSPRYALWGELMSIRAIHCGAAGAGWTVIPAIPMAS